MLQKNHFFAIGPANIFFADVDFLLTFGWICIRPSLKDFMCGFFSVRGLGWLQISLICFSGYSQKIIGMVHLSRDQPVTGDSQIVVGPVTYTVTPSANPTEGGTVDPDAPQQVNHGEQIVIEIGVNEGYDLQMPIGGTCGGILNDLTYTTAPVTADCTVIVNFSPRTYTVEPIWGGNGRIVPGSPQTVTHGHQAEFDILPDEGYQIKTPVGGTCGGTLDETLMNTVHFCFRLQGESKNEEC